MVRTSTRSSSARGRALAVVLGLVAVALVAPWLPSVRGQEAEAPKEGGGKVLGDKKCFFCHRDMKESFPSTIHGGLLEEGSAVCEGCHGPGEMHVGTMGEVEHIVRFGELSPEEASKRCLSCHEKTAGDGHVKGFLESSYLARGMGCTTCHDSHAPAEKRKAAAPASDKPTRVGEETCLVCHSDRPEMVEFGHRQATADLLGCESCHGPGSVHAASRGAPGTIRNLHAIEPAKSNRTCLLCHREKGSPEHFTPAPGKERCVDCHVIHVPPKVAEAPPEETPGKPPFKFEVEGEAPEEGRLQAFHLGLPPPMPASQASWAGLDWAGFAKLGYRFVDVSGNDKVYAQHLDYDQGFRLFDVAVDGSAEEGALTRLHFSAEGIDDPVEHYRLEARDRSTWSFSAKAQRSNIVYYATGDPRDMRSKRQDLGLTLNVIPDEFLRVTAGYDVYTRKGGRRGTRFVSGVPDPLPSDEPIDEIGHHAYARMDVGGGPATLSLTAGYRWEELEEGIRARDAVTSTTVVFDEKTDVSAPIVSAVLALRPQESFDVKAKVLWTELDTDTDYDSVTADPGTTVRTDGQVDGERSFLRWDLSGTWFADPALSVTTRVEGFVDDTRSKSVATTDGTTERTRIDRDHDRYRFVGEAGYRAVEWAFVHVGFEWIAERFKVKEAGVRRKHDTHVTGPFISADIDATKDLSVELLYRFVRVDEPFADISAQDQNQARIRVRYQATETLTLTAFAIHQLRTNTLRDTDVLAWSAGFSGVWQILEDLSLNASYEYRAYSTETDGVRFIAGTPVYGRSEYDSATNGLMLDLFWMATPKLRLTAGGSYYDTSGDYPTDILDIRLGAEYALLRHVALGADLRWNNYDEKDRTVDDFDAFLAELWVRLGF